MKQPPGTQWCKSCERFLPEDQFLKLLGHAVRFCNACANENMRKWAAERTGTKSHDQALKGQKE